MCLAALLLLPAVCCQLNVPVAGAFSLTGAYAASGGASMSNAVQLFTELTNQKEARTGSPPVVRIVTSIADDTSTAPGVQAAITAFRDGGAQLYVGPFTTEFTLAALAALNNSNYVLVAPSASKITLRWSACVFFVVPSTLR